tara:strand:- start:151 stop:369 length:219 start_codon:yes stop_codon:yes gene_type:complete
MPDNETTQGSTALMLACKRGKRECIEALVGMGSDIFALDTRGRTANYHATKHNHESLVRRSVEIEVEIEVEV